MPPPAWALASLWSAVWDAPRFQGPGRVHPPALSREALAPLLKIAASCVAALQPYAGCRSAQVPLHGASRELLAAAVDGSPGGRALSDPVGDPQGFVWALAKAAFQTGDGGYAEGLSEESLDALLEKHCAPQLEQAARLREDPSAELRATLKGVHAAVKELAETRPLPGDLAGTAKRLLLVQRLERIAEEAKELTAADRAVLKAAEQEAERLEEPAEAAAERLEEEYADWEHEMEQDSGCDQDGPLQRTKTVTSTSSPNSSSTDGADGAQLAQPIRLPKRPCADIPGTPPPDSVVASFAAAKSVPAEETAPQAQAEEGSVSPLKRTQSQFAATLKINKVKQHLDANADAIHDLRRTASQLVRAHKEVPEDEAEALEAELEAVNQACKRARIFGEDLIEDMLELDNLSKVLPEDRKVRKVAITGIESLLEDVDAADARLGSLRKDLETKLAAIHEAEEKAAAERQKRRRADEAPSESAPELAPSDEDMDASADEEDASADEEMETSQATAPRRKTMAAGYDAPAPDKTVWQKVRLPLRFHSREEEDHYNIAATVPGLDVEELRLEVAEDGRALFVTGLRLPTPEQAAQMRQRINARLEALARRSPQRFATLGEQLPQACTDAYVELGQGEFGRFAETFRIPKDVLREGIKASYVDGVLRIVLPRMTHVAPHPMPFGPRGRGGGRFFGGGSRGGGGGYPSDTHPGARAARPGAPLFGGLDDSFWW